MAKSIKNSSEVGSMPAYKLEHEEYLNDVKGCGLVYRHIKTGARVCVVSNDDDNKVFLIGFRTPPTDSTGVAHIIEHTVLCGSEKFKPKDPFIELCKGSLNTFLNAFTYPDKTVYPAASCNEKDFANLMDVYMDAVFHPNIYRKEEIFRQEGWHYELEEKAGELTINGVVYSEMKGVFSSPEDRQMRGAFNAMFPDNEYGVESGGDPESIPDLTYEQFLEFHKRYYHPTNSYIYLYGNVDIEERLGWLDENYLSKYTYQPVDSVIKRQKPIGTIELTNYYPLGEDDDENEASFLTYAFNTGEFDDIETNMACDLLCDVLFNAPGAPVKQALIDAGIGQDIMCGVMNDLYQPFGMIVAKNTEGQKMNDFKRILREQFDKQIHDKLNRNSLLAAINKNEFTYREADFGSFPRGLMYGVTALETWLYDDDNVFGKLKQNDIFADLKKKLDTDYYEKLIEKYMLNSRHEAYCITAPKKGMGAEIDNTLAAKLEAYKAGLGEMELEELIRKTKALKEYQETPSTKEELETLPMLDRSDIDRKIKPLRIEEKITAGAAMVLHEYDTNGIIYYNLMFNMDILPERLIPYTGLLSKLIGNMDTDEHSYLEYNNEVNIYTGGIGSSITSFGYMGRKDYYRPMFNINCKVMYENVDKSFSLVNEQLLHTRFNDTKRIKDLLAESCSRMQATFNSSGHAVAIGRAMSYISSQAKFKEIIGGVDYYCFIERLYNEFDSKKGEIVQSLNELVKLLFGSDNLVISVTCDSEGCEKFMSAADKYMADFGCTRLDSYRNGVFSDYAGIAYKKCVLNEGFKLPGQVQFWAASGDYGKSGYEYTGCLAVVKNILDNSYLWNNIRVLGGAYGCGCSFSSIDGKGFMYSYRDPKLSETKDIFLKASDYLKNFEADEREMTKYIIGTVGGIDTPLTPSGMGARSLGAYMSGITEDILQKRRDQLLDTDINNVRECAAIIEAMFSDICFCVVGNDSKIENNKELFGQVKNLLQVYREDYGTEDI